MAKPLRASGTTEATIVVGQAPVVHAAAEHRLPQLALLLLRQDVLPVAGLVAEADGVLEEIEIEELLGGGEVVPLAAGLLGLLQPLLAPGGALWLAPLPHGARGEIHPPPAATQTEA